MAFLQVKSGCCGSSLQSSTRTIAIVMLTLSSLNYLYIIYQATTQHLPLWSILFQLITTSLGVLINAMLLQGANKRKPCLLLPWLAFMALDLVILAISILVCTGLTIYWAIKDPTAGVNTVMVGVTLLCAFFLALYTYLFAIVLSFYLELKAEQNRGGILPTKHTEVPHQRLNEEERDPTYPPVYPGLA